MYPIPCVDMETMKFDLRYLILELRLHKQSKQHLWKEAYRGENIAINVSKCGQIY